MFGQAITSVPQAPASKLLAQSAWVWFLRGCVAIIFGLAAMTYARAALPMLISMFGTYFIVDGVLALLASVRPVKATDPWMGIMYRGILSIAIAITMFRMPHLTALTLTYLVAVWAMVAGSLEIAADIDLHKVIPSEALVAVSGLFSILLAWFVLAVPAAGLHVLAMAVGIYALLYGIVTLFFGARVRGLGPAS